MKNNDFKSGLYVISISAAGPCKIGRAVNPAFRLCDLQVGNSEKLTLWSTWTSKHLTTKQAEAVVHDLFDAKRIRGEWFGVTVQQAEAVLAAMDDKMLHQEVFTKSEKTRTKLISTTMACHPLAKLRLEA